MVKPWWLLGALATAGCNPGSNGQFDHDIADAQSPPSVDAHYGPNTELPVVIDHVAHFPIGFLSSLSDDSDVTIDVPTVIDTTAGTVTPPLASGLILPSVSQNVGGNVMVIDVGSLTITADVSIVGAKPLVLVGRRSIIITALVDASAHGDVPGPGGYASDFGPGRGNAGQTDGAGTDGGGGGAASFGVAQYGRGGSPNGGAPGTWYPSGKALERLVGGSGGGAPGVPDACTVAGGAGGGALQLSTGTLTLEGSITAGGGGGRGGVACGSNGSGGAGGGAGGLIYIDTRRWLGNGVLSANGGAGGEGAGPNGEAGADGGDASALLGGMPSSLASGGGIGGGGAGGSTFETAGADVATGNNGGGGGGGFGGIYFHLDPCDFEFGPSYRMSPSAVAALPWSHTHLCL